MILLHGRGGSADDILSLARELDHPGFAYLAPQAAGFTWYPQRFTAPLTANEPHLTSALKVVHGVLGTAESAGIRTDNIVLVGFSQGACLTLEFVARNASRYGAVIAFTGGLLGPAGRHFDFAGDFAGTPMLLAAGDPDPHVPWQRVEESAIVLRDLGAYVTLKRYPGLGHTINAEEIRMARNLVERAV